MKLRRFGFPDLIILICVVLGMVGFTLAAQAQMGARDAQIRCTANLRQIGQAILLYTNENRGMYPRTKYAVASADHPTSFTGINAKDPFLAGGPLANDVSADMFLLLRTEDLTSKVFVCPASNAQPDNFGGGKKSALDRSNFSSTHVLSYSFANPYPARAAVAKGYRLVQGLNPAFVVAADINPGSPDLLKLTVNAAADKMRMGNSRNHSQQGQCALYGDGHVDWNNNPFIGVDRDNIYTCGLSGIDPVSQAPRPSGGTAIAGSPISPDDSVLLPTDMAAQP